MSQTNRLVEYFLVVGVDSKKNDGEKQQGGPASTSTPPTSPITAITEGADGKTRL